VSGYCQPRITSRHTRRGPGISAENSLGQTGATAMSSNVLASLVTDETKREHRQVVGLRGRVRPAAGEDPAHRFDARPLARLRLECSYGWASKTGGAIKARVAEALTDHRLHEQCWQGLDDAENWPPDHGPASPGRKRQGRWQTVCEPHGFVCSHQTLELARWHCTPTSGAKSAPVTWTPRPTRKSAPTQPA
jgi:hypothetical protein